ncbi:MAG: triple tyrosine motif-containing protein [Candidatus Vogelbacteria bacterium]|nr:triple tyrosine motif-containing protein [Candidatus Vogelbacteria bacterium]
MNNQSILIFRNVFVFLKTQSSRLPYYSLKRDSVNYDRYPCEVKKVQTIIGILLLFFSAPAQEIPILSFSRFDSKKELPSDEYHMIFQSKNDIMWFGNDNGLLQYDGYDFTTPATSSGLLKYAPSSGKLKAIQPSSYLNNNRLNNNCSSLAYENDGKIWFSTSSGIYCYWIGQDSLRSYQVVDRTWKGNVNVTDIMVSSGKDIWVGTWSRGMAKFNKAKQQFETVYFNRKYIADNVKVIREDNQGRFWVGSWQQGLFVVDVSDPENPNILNHFVHNPANQNSIAGNIIYSLDFDDKNRVWIGTPYGLSILSGQEGLNPYFNNLQQNSDQSTIANNEIRSVYRDHSGLIWLATWGGGINKIAVHTKEIEYYSIPNVDPLIKSQSVYSFTIDHKKRLLVGVQGLGFGAYDLSIGKFTPYTAIPEYKKLAGLMLNTVRCFEWNKDSDLWIGDRYKGIVKLRTSTGEFINLNNKTVDKRFPVRGVFSFRSEANGRLWVATNNGLYRICQGKSGRFNDLEINRYSFTEKDRNSLSENLLSDVVIDKDGYLWVSTFENGLYQSRDKVSNSDSLSFDHFSAVNDPNCGLGSNKISCLFNDSSGRIWIGTIGKGLKYWSQQAKRFEQPVFFGTMDGLVVYSISEDSGRNIWITTNKGLKRIRPSHDKYEIEQFSADDGLQGNVFIKGASFFDSNSNLYIGGHNGFNRLITKQIKIEEFMPKIIITSVRVDDRIVNPLTNGINQPLVMNHRDKYFTVAFSALDFLNPDQNKYAYMLEGFDNTWQYANSNARSASFGNLSPGHYKFILKATNSRGKWNPEPIFYYLVVKTAPYKTWWAILLYLLFTGGLIYLFLALRIKNIQIQKSLELENIKRSKSENLTQFKLQFFTNISHELLTPLSILKILVDRWDAGSAKNIMSYREILSRNINRLDILINQSLQFRKAETGNLKINLQEVNIVPFIQAICENYNILAEKKNIDFQVVQPDEIICILDIEKIEIMLNNLLSNAFKYTPGGEFNSGKYFDIGDK